MVRDEDHSNIIIMKIIANMREKIPETLNIVLCDFSDDSGYA